jgi:S-formylglutathione hydrolase
VDRPCPEFDATRTPERHVREDVLAFVQHRWQLAPPAVGLLGIGMGGQGALRLAFKDPERFPAVAAVSAALDYYELYGHGTPLDHLYNSKEQCRQDTALLHVHPSRYPPHLFFAVTPDDPWFRGNDRLDEKLIALGIPHEKDFQARAGGHSWAYFDQLAERSLRFVYAGLEQQSRRLL